MEIQQYQIQPLDKRSVAAAYQAYREKVAYEKARDRYERMSGIQRLFTRQPVDPWKEMSAKDLASFVSSAFEGSHQNLNVYNGERRPDEFRTSVWLEVAEDGTLKAKVDVTDSRVGIESPDGQRAPRTHSQEVSISEDGMRTERSVGERIGSPSLDDFYDRSSRSFIGLRNLVEEPLTREEKASLLSGVREWRRQVAADVRDGEVARKHMYKYAGECFDLNRYVQMRTEMKDFMKEMEVGQRGNGYREVCMFQGLSDRVAEYEKASLRDVLAKERRERSAYSDIYSLMEQSKTDYKLVVHHDYYEESYHTENFYKEFAVKAREHGFSVPEITDAVRNDRLSNGLQSPKAGSGVALTDDRTITKLSLDVDERMIDGLSRCIEEGYRGSRSASEIIGKYNAGIDLSASAAAQAPVSSLKDAFLRRVEGPEMYERDVVMDERMPVKMLASNMMDAATAMAKDNDPRLSDFLNDCGVRFKDGISAESEFNNAASRMYRTGGAMDINRVSGFTTKWSDAILGAKSQKNAAKAVQKAAVTLKPKGLKV